MHYNSEGTTYLLIHVIKLVSNEPGKITAQKHDMSSRLGMLKELLTSNNPHVSA